MTPSIEITIDKYLSGDIDAARLRNESERDYAVCALRVYTELRQRFGPALPTVLIALLGDDPNANCRSGQ